MHAEGLPVPCDKANPSCESTEEAGLCPLVIPAYDNSQASVLPGSWSVCAGIRHVANWKKFDCKQRRA
ncbi:hypothetical protein AV530_007611 [Patagioenas fasciata monilis]|uniref:Uncharacterized protein n=1 Tax=Patagioenas fasciata monilis TaxID=372326 RepID=A0A1V4JYM0_PATFA|nr:hypothetical protein AV530_007611 [Patagioenas fasciata monilis]